MERGLILTGWVVITLLYIAMHHGYNKLTRAIGWEDEDDAYLNVFLGGVYIVVNIVYFLFTYDAFITIASRS